MVVPPIKREVPSFEAQDLLIEVNLGIVDEPRQIKSVAYLARVNKIN